MFESNQLKKHLTPLIFGPVALLFIFVGFAHAQKYPHRSKLRTLRAVPPIYPGVASTAKVSGAVVVKVWIDPVGTVNSAILVSGPKLLQPVSLSAALRWGFNPSNSTRARTARLVFDFVYLTGDPPAIALVPVFLPPFTVRISGSKPAITTRTDADPGPTAESPRPTAPKQIKIIGLSVAYNLWPPRSRHLGPNSRDYDLVVKVISILSGEAAPYIRMRYRHSKDDPELPDYFNNGKSWWLLPLTREPDCDNALMFEIPVVSTGGVLDAVVPGFQRPPGTELEPIPTTVLPCYELQPGKF